MIVRDATSAERQALGRDVETCECGVALDAHPPLPRPLPWDHGRPCGRAIRDGGVQTNVFSRAWRSRPAEA